MPDVTPFAFIATVEAVLLQKTKAKPLFVGSTFRVERLLDFIEQKAMLRAIRTEGGEDIAVGSCNVEAVSAREKGLTVFQGSITAPEAGHSQKLFVLLKNKQDLIREAERVVGILLRFWGIEERVAVEALPVAALRQETVTVAGVSEAVAVAEREIVPEALDEVPMVDGPVI